MSLLHVKQIIDQALADETYFARLMNSPEETFSDKDLSDSEKGMLRGLSKSPYTLARKGLADTQRLVVAALEYAPAPKNS